MHESTDFPVGKDTTDEQADEQHRDDDVIPIAFRLTVADITASPFTAARNMAQRCSISNVLSYVAREMSAFG
jgi:hypothetical protein